MIKLSISAQIMSNAIEHSKERFQYEYNRFGFSVAKRKSMILIGTIGQLMFKNYLEDNGIDFEFEFQAGKYDEMDFSISDEIVEIKTSGFEGNYLSLNLLYSEDQFRAGMAKNFKYCVQIFINGYNRKEKLIYPYKCNECIIAGYIPFENISNYKNFKRFYGEDYKVPLKDLLPINKLI